MEREFPQKSPDSIWSLNLPNWVRLVLKRYQIWQKCRCNHTEAVLRARSHSGELQNPPSDPKLPNIKATFPKPGWSINAFRKVQPAAYPLALQFGNKSSFHFTRTFPGLTSRWKMLHLNSPEQQSNIKAYTSEIVTSHTGSLCYSGQKLHCCSKRFHFH